MNLKMTFRLAATIALCIFCSASSRGQQTPTKATSPVLEGSWMAGIDSGQTFRGAWSGQTSPQNPNTARGSWTLFGDENSIVLEGTWSARKTGQGWQGAWTARTARGQTISGTWQADLASFGGKTLEQMLQRTVEKEVAGFWASGRHQGNWWLQGSRERRPQ